MLRFVSLLLLSPFFESNFFFLLWITNGSYQHCHFQNLLILRMLFRALPERLKNRKIISIFLVIPYITPPRIFCQAKLRHFEKLSKFFIFADYFYQFLRGYTKFSYCHLLIFKCKSMWIIIKNTILFIIKNIFETLKKSTFYKCSIFL